MLSRLERRQLVAFAIVTVITVGVLLVNYMRIPALVGWNRYQVTISMSNASGLHGGDPVTFRGAEVGDVRQVNLTDTGVVALVSLQDGVSIPRSSQARVEHGSVIGEPYLDLVYVNGPPTPLQAGDVIPASQVSVPVSTGQLFVQAQSLLRSLPLKALTTTINEASTALSGNQGALTGVLDSTQKLVSSAASNAGPTIDLLDTLGPVLKTQQQLQQQIRGSVTSLDSVTAALAQSDGALRTLLSNAGPTARLVSQTLTTFQKYLPGLLAAGAEISDVLSVYLPSIQHLLIALPALLAAQSAVAMYDPATKYGEAGLSFKIMVNDPPICTTGFPEAGHQRAPEDLSPKAIPSNSYCKLSSSDPRITRGARNFPCPNSGARGATAAMCHLVFDPAELSGKSSGPATSGSPQ